jgi:flagellar biosynthesis protein FlhG
MNQTPPSNKVINLVSRLEKRKIAARQNRKNRKASNRKSSIRVIAITSGKGGVGKTNIVANLGYAFSQLGKKVLILDADIGLGNLDVLLGIAPKYNLSHVILGEKNLKEIIICGPGDMRILPASSGIQELTSLSQNQKIKLLTEIDKLINSVDILLIDTAAGISSNVMDFSVSAHEIIVVASPEPTSITDAYALMKVLSLKYSENRCYLLTNLVANAQEGKEVFRQLSLVTKKFLDINIDYLGCVVFDDKVPRCLKNQKIICELYPETDASRCYHTLAKKISSRQPMKLPDGDTNLFWHHLVQDCVV